jgi:16S rRNA (adenine1518-N6/adenine1519-N6)-dimethyltransferase
MTDLPESGPESGPEIRPAKAPRLDPLAVRRQLRDEGLRARRSMSQNFLADPDVLQSILDIAEPNSGGRILEVGPGLGILTGGLLAAGAKVTAVELDKRLAGRLSRVQSGAIESGALRLIDGDILDQKIAELMAPPYDVVANVPYHITSPILHRFLSAPPRPRRMVLMLQREVAERISAAPGDMSYLSVFVQFHAAVRIAFVVPREAFEPAPEVESAVVVIEPHDPLGLAPRLAATDEEELSRLVQVGFHERRKMVRNVLTRQIMAPAAEIDAALTACGIDGERRPQTLSVDEWLALREALRPLPADKVRDAGAGTRGKGGGKPDAPASGGSDRGGPSGGPARGGTGRGGDRTGRGSKPAAAARRPRR